MSDVRMTDQGHPMDPWTPGPPAPNPPPPPPPDKISHRRTGQPVSRYAANTEVTAGKSRDEIERTLQRSPSSSPTGRTAPTGVATACTLHLGPAVAGLRADTLTIASIKEPTP